MNNSERGLQANNNSYNQRNDRITAAAFQHYRNLMLPLALYGDAKERISEYEEAAKPSFWKSIIQAIITLVVLIIPAEIAAAIINLVVIIMTKNSWESTFMYTEIAVMAISILLFVVLPIAYKIYTFCEATNKLPKERVKLEKMEEALSSVIGYVPPKFRNMRALNCMVQAYENGMVDSLQQAYYLCDANNEYDYTPAEFSNIPFYCFDEYAVENTMFENWYDNNVFAPGVYDDSIVDMKPTESVSHIFARVAYNFARAILIGLIVWFFIGNVHIFDGVVVWATDWVVSVFSFLYELIGHFIWILVLIGVAAVAAPQATGLLYYEWGVGWVEEYTGSFLLAGGAIILIILSIANPPCIEHYPMNDPSSISELLFIGSILWGAVAGIVSMTFPSMIMKKG